jgi:hypothetical protein
MRTQFALAAAVLLALSACATPTGGRKSADLPDFGDNASEWAYDGECDDPRFAGEGMDETLLPADQGHDAADCRGLWNQGKIRNR